MLADTAVIKIMGNSSYLGEDFNQRRSFMFTKNVQSREADGIDCPVSPANSEVNVAAETDAVVQRKIGYDEIAAPKSFIYERARILYIRGRTRHQSKAASIL